MILTNPNFTLTELSQLLEDVWIETGTDARVLILGKSSYERLFTKLLGKEVKYPIGEGQPKTRSSFMGFPIVIDAEFDDAIEVY